MTGAWAAGAPTLGAQATDNEIEAWISTQLETAGSEMRGVRFDEAVEFYDPRELEKQADGNLVARFRVEYWRPQREGRTTWRSSRQRVEIDCKTFRARFLSVDHYPENNLKGRAVAEVMDGEWFGPFPEGEVGDVELKQACSFSSLLDSASREASLPPSPPTFDDQTVGDWLKARVKPGDDVFLKREGMIGLYYSPADLEQLPNGRVRGWVRRELAWPIVLGNSGVRSTRMQYEIDCTRRRYKSLDLIVFPGLNHTGPGYADFTDDEADLKPIKAGSSEAPVMRALCRLAADPKITPAEALRPAPVPTLENPSDEALQAWVETHINTSGYVISSTDTSSITLYEPASLTLLRDGHVTALVRFESFQPSSDPAYSMLMRIEIDCAARRSRQLGASGYLDANLEGVAHESGATDWSRIEKDTHVDLLLPEVCAQRALLAQDVDREAALTPSPLADDDAAIATWMADYVRPLSYVYVGHTDEAAAFYSWDEGERTRQDFVRVWTRLEYFSPQTAERTAFRSKRHLMEYDCDQGRSRTLTTEVYPGANLTGKPAISRSSTADWGFTEPGTLDNGMADAVCDLKDEADAQEADALSRPRLPGPNGRQPL